MVRKFCEWMLRHRYFMLGIILIITGCFLVPLLRIQVKTQFVDLLPKNHPFIKVHQQYEKQLGSPYKVFLMLKVKTGDIYNPETLKKTKEITDQLDLVPGVNHNQLYSIASRKIKKVTITADGIITQNFMDQVPATKEELKKFQETVRKTVSVYRVWVSPDEKSLLFSASFIPDSSDPKIIFKKIRDLKQNLSDANHEIYMAGEPILTGWIYSFQKESYQILGFSILAMFFLLYYYFRNLVGVLVPLSSTVIGAIWGLGFCGLVGFNLEPLTLVLPLLITARALSHSIQITERYFECYHESKEVIPACIEATTSIFPPGLLGILCDVVGILLIAVAPVPVIQKLAFLCAFWAFGIIPTGLVFTPILLSFFTPPKNISDIVDMKKGFTQKILGGVSKLGFGKVGVTTFIVGILLSIMAGWNSLSVNIGDINPGTPILWKDSDYNIAIKEINKNFPGTDELYIIVEGNEQNCIQRPDILNLLESFQRHMEKDPRVSTTLSAQDFLPPIYGSIYSGYCKCQVLPTDARDAGQLFFLLTANSAPGDYDLYFNRDRSNANVIIWFKDHMGDTIRSAIARVNDFVEKNQDRIAKAKVKFQLASGIIGILAAANEVVEKSQLLNLILVMSTIFILCSITYRSMMAAVILIIPLNLANVITLSIMKGMGIGLNINTLPIISVGVGVGIDYGIYLLSRICEEYQRTGEYSFNTLSTSLRTTGKAIFFTNTTMCSGIIFYYFFSSLRFQAEMGLLLTIIMFMNMIGALILIPAIVYVFKPKFLGKAQVLVKKR